jgi:hypothetical protein
MVVSTLVFDMQPTFANALSFSWIGIAASLPFSLLTARMLGAVQIKVIGPQYNRLQGRSRAAVPAR